MTLLSSLRVSFEQKGQRIFSYMQGLQKPRIKSLVTRIVDAQLSAGDKSALCPGIVLLLLEYFEEQADVLIACAEVRFWYCSLVISWEYNGLIFFPALMGLSGKVEI